MSLIKSAYAGIAASLIQGETAHPIGCISVNGKGLCDAAKAKLANMWKDVQCLVLDECSMLPERFLAQLSERITIAKMAHNPAVADLAFGRVNVIMCGENHQFPPVAGGSNSTLYRPNDPSKDSTEARIRSQINEKFDKVVVLRHQVRVSDTIWHDFLARLRHGQVQATRTSMLKSLVLTNPECVEIAFESDTWSKASLVTPRHVVRNQWNDAAVARHCHYTGSQCFICPANDTILKKTSVDARTIRGWMLEFKT
ncbi:hypothetical protein FRC08_003007 [Ceratobasidium sp. 394]|nr:hypothetical protein FRC08_003007 [Ceratobasidium sp. 394]